MQTKFVEPIELSSEGEAIAILIQEWPDRPQAKLLAPIVVRMRPLPRETSESVAEPERAVRGLLRQLDKEKDTGLALIRYLASSLHEHEDDPVRTELVDALREQCFDFESRAVRYEPRHGFNPAPFVAASMLRNASLIDPERMIDWEEVLEDGREHEVWFKRNTGSSSEGWKNADSLRSLAFWMRESVAGGLSVVEKRQREAANTETVVLLEKGAQRALAWRNVRDQREHPTNYKANFADVVDAMRSHLAYVRTVGGALAVDEHPRFAEILLRLRWMAFDGDESEIDPATQTHDVALAKRELGRLRSRLIEANPTEQVAILDEATDHLQACERAIFTGDGLWDGMKALLLLIRALKVPAFGSDLSWWNAAAKPVRAWSVASLAQDLMFGFQAFARTEQEDDPKLVELRTDLARFCVERLSTRKDKTGPTEPDPTWRYGYVRALGELGVNPDGKGHRTLHHVMNDDDDPHVREAARKIYPRLREQRAAPEGNPRRAVLAALWWIRQAQMTDVGGELDPDGANRTRAEEVRYTARGHRNE